MCTIQRRCLSLMEIIMCIMRVQVSFFHAQHHVGTTPRHNKTSFLPPWLFIGCFLHALTSHWPVITYGKISSSILRAGRDYMYTHAHTHICLGHASELPHLSGCSPTSADIREIVYQGEDASNLPVPFLFHLSDTEWVR